MRQPYPPNSNLLVSFALAEENLAKELGVEKCQLMPALKARDKAKAQAQAAAKKSKSKKSKPKVRPPLPNPLLPLHDARKYQKPLPYADYLRTEHWRITRLRMFKRVGKRCQQCGATDKIQVHHTSYRHLWYEWQADLRVLCATCHEIEHDLFEYHA